MEIPIKEAVNRDETWTSVLAWNFSETKDPSIGNAFFNKEGNTILVYYDSKGDLEFIKQVE